MNYDKIGVAARNLARDILRGQTAVRIQERLSTAKADLIKAIRSFAVLKRDWAKEDAAVAKANTERSERQTSFDESLAAIENLSSEERKAAADAVEADRVEAEKKASEEAEAIAKSRTASETKAMERIEAARTDVKHHQENLDKVNKGDMKVDADELKALAQKLIEEGRVTELAEVSAEE